MVEIQEMYSYLVQRLVAASSLIGIVKKQGLVYKSCGRTKRGETPRKIENGGDR
jgi:hypothetical protein